MELPFDQYEENGTGIYELYQDTVPTYPMNVSFDDPEAMNIYDQMVKALLYEAGRRGASQLNLIGIGTSGAMTLTLLSERMGEDHNLHIGYVLMAKEEGDQKHHRMSIESNRATSRLKSGLDVFVDDLIGSGRTFRNVYDRWENHGGTLDGVCVTVDNYNLEKQDKRDVSLIIRSR